MIVLIDLVILDQPSFGKLQGLESLSIETLKYQTIDVSIPPGVFEEADMITIAENRVTYIHGTDKIVSTITYNQPTRISEIKENPFPLISLLIDIGIIFVGLECIKNVDSLGIEIFSRPL